ncbi:MAG TPA: M28 family peptidase, partial [Isosphaeraceae bacterium]|nr:M28 family peptidase [Isosphaeraceae bacterium]
VKTALRPLAVLQVLPFLILLALVPEFCRGEDATTPLPAETRLRAHVELLASPAFAGRRGPGARKTAAYLVDAFQSLHLEPAFGDSYLQDIPGEEPGTILGRNVAATLEGSDPDLKEEYVLVTAHYDHLGVRDGVLYPGADDNASGTAMMLELARCFASMKQRPRRSLMFVGFDLEEYGLWGSRHFAEHPPIPLEDIKLFLTADMVARSLGGVCKSYLFVMGSEHAPELRAWVNQAAEGLPLTLGIVGSDLLFFDRSDYGPFRERKVPYLFFSTGENPRYHTPRDTPETLDYKHLEAVARMVEKIVREAANADSVPSWSPEPDHPFGEAVVLRDVLNLLLEHRDELEMKPLSVALIRAQIKTLSAVIERGTITPSERQRMLRGAQVILYSVL